MRRQRLRCEGIGEAFNDAKHQPLLERLWAAAYPTTSCEDRTSAAWTKLGFQGDPALDLRGVGAFGLRQLVRFVESSQRGAAALREASKGNSFPLASLSLTVTQMVCSHLGLLTQPAGGVGALAECGDSVFHEVWRLQIALGDGLSLVDLIHESVLLRLHASWQDLTAARAQGIKLMRCPSMLRELGAHLISTLEACATAPWDLAALLLALRQAPLSQGRSCWEAAGALLNRHLLGRGGAAPNGCGAPTLLTAVSAMLLLGAAQPGSQC